MLDLVTRFVSPGLVALALLSLNFTTFALFGWDKVKAESGARRIRESTLLQFALIGGTLGAYAGRKVFRHKTRKQPFSGNLHFIAVLQAVVLTGGAAWLVWAG